MTWKSLRFISGSVRDCCFVLTCIFFAFGRWRDRREQQHQDEHRRRRNRKATISMSPVAAKTRSRLKRYPALADIENQTGRVVSIETALTDDLLRRCQLQHQSPLFRLPAEIRNLILIYALNSEVGKSGRGRPPSRGFARSTGILCTCRRIWLEANSIALEQAEPVFWLLSDHAYSKAFSTTQSAWPDSPQVSVRRQDSLEDMSQFLMSLTPNNIYHLKHVRLVADPDWLRNTTFFNTFTVFRAPWPVRLTISIWCVDEPEPGYLHTSICRLLAQVRLPGLLRLTLEIAVLADHQTEFRRALDDHWTEQRKLDVFAGWLFSGKSEMFQDGFSFLEESAQHTLVSACMRLSWQREPVPCGHLGMDWADLAGDNPSDTPTLRRLDDGMGTSVGENGRFKCMKAWFRKWQAEGSLLKLI